MNLDDINTYIKPNLEHMIDLFILNKSDPQSCFVEIPEAKDAELSIEELRNYVARTSNNYARAARLAGAAKAVEKRAEGLYKIKYKKGLAAPAKNTALREAHAIEQSEAEYKDYILAQSIVELALAMEAAARVSSESARKLLDKAYGSNIGDYRSQTHASY